MPGVLRVYTVQSANASYPEICKTVRPWESILPSLPEPDEEPHFQIRFLRRFLELTNEIERAIRETEVYPVITIKRWIDDNQEYLIAEEDDRSETLPMFDGSTPSMVSYLSNEDAQGRKSTEIYIGQSADLKIEQRIEPAEFWTLHELPPSSLVQPGVRVQLGPKQVMLRRFARPNGQILPQPPSLGFLRIRGMFAQVKLIERREEAIDLVATHTFLQRALVLPDTVYMDTGIDELPLPLPPEDKFDRSKRDALNQIWRTRPIYYLQGPPGTGKTTLVAQLLRQIYGDDPSCQVLLTAQAHSAVDHLRNEVSKFVSTSQKEEPSWLAPLAVRHRKPKPGDVEPEIQDPAYPSSVARQILDDSIRVLERRAEPADYINDWIAYARLPSDDGDFEQLVRRSANFVYCTSTAGDLLELAQSHQTFDWSIIEEAGKAHGFDLVLPLQTGHRWLLIGDQNQLPPYRDKDFARGLDRLETICSSNHELRRFWGGMTAVEHQRFTDDAKRWLFFFRELFNTAETRIQSETPLVGMLTEQHRMHPHIGDLISHAFYRNKISNGTYNKSTGLPAEKVLHHFVAPKNIRKQAIVWANVPLRSKDLGDGDEGVHLNSGEISAVASILRALHAEASRHETTAVLTPYRRQVRGLRDALDWQPSWSILPDGHEDLDQGRVGVFTVDSFQGQQAAVVFVSLVRNNTERKFGAAFGFLREHERINVMMSRAEKLLVLVGSWEFFRAHLADQSREEGQPFAELARLSDWLAQAFVDGRALLIPASEFGKESAQ